MKLTFIGSGSAFTLGTDNFHSNMLLSDDANNRLLIDCGSDARWALDKLGLSHKDITDVYISHLHADHAGGLEWLAFTSKFDSSSKKPNLYICEKLVTDLWDKVLSGGLNSLQMELATLESYYNVHSVHENSTFFWSTLELRIIQTVHIVSGFTIMPSYGLFFNANDKNVFITTDMQFSPHQIKDIYRKADIIFHDCEITKEKSYVHAHYDELLTLAPEIKSKIWLYHYNPSKLPDAKKDGFRGFVLRGQVFDFNDPDTLN